MQRSHAGIAAPGENQLRCAARADQLIVDQIRRHPDQRQIAPPLADDFVPGGKGNQVREAFQRHDIAVANHFLDRLFEWKNVRQTVIMPWREGRDWHLTPASAECRIEVTLQCPGEIHSTYPC